MSETRWGAYMAIRIEDLLRGKGRAQWDGEWPALDTIEAAWQTAVDTIPHDAPTPSVVPTGDGHVAFIWLKRRWNIEVEVGGEAGPDVWAQHREGEQFDGPLAGQRDRLRALLSELGADDSKADVSAHA